MSTRFDLDLRRLHSKRRSIRSAFPNRTIGTLCFFTAFFFSAIAQPTEIANQTDWSGAPSSAGPSQSWGNSFGSSEGVSWLAIPGQITLSGILRDPPTRQVIADDFVGPASLDVADIDGDGDLDVAGAAIESHEIAWWRNDGGDPPAWTGASIEQGFTGASSVHARDVDRDGSVDLVGCAWDAGEVAVWYNAGQGASWAKQTITTGFAAAHWVDTADVDGDGDVDLFGAAANANTVGLWLNDGGQPIAWTFQAIDSSFRGARSLVPADVDGDGDLDVIGTALVDNELSWWRNGGGEPIAWSKEILDSSFGGAHHAGAWDIELDGDLDIIAAGYSAAWLSMWRNDGSDPVGWSEEPFGAAILGALVVDVADLDGDGDLDVIASSERWDRVMWWQNIGEGPADWPSLIIHNGFANAWPLALADLDGNGTVDVLSGASGAAEVSWWRVTDFVESGSLESGVLAISDNVAILQCAIDAVLPPETAVAVEFRVGGNPDQLGDWGSIEANQPTSVMVSGPAYLQYRVSLSTTDPTVGPILREIRFEWTSELSSPPPRRSGHRVRP